MAKQWRAVRVSSTGHVEWEDGGEGRFEVTPTGLAGYYDITYPTNAASPLGPCFAHVTTTGAPVTGQAVATVMQPYREGCTVRTSAGGGNTAAGNNGFSFMVLSDTSFIGYDQSILNLGPLCHYNSDVANTSSIPVDMVSNQVFTKFGTFSVWGASVFNLGSNGSYASNNSSNGWYQNYNPPASYYSTTPTVALVFLHRTAYTPQLGTAMSLEDNTAAGNGFTVSLFRQGSPFPVTPQVRVGSLTIPFTTEIPQDAINGALLIVWLDPVLGWSVQYNNGPVESSGDLTAPTYTGTQRFWQANSRQEAAVEAFVDPIYRLSYFDKVLTAAERTVLYEQLLN